MSFISIEQALNDIRAGKMLIIVDDESRENEGDLYIPADKVSPEAINFMSKYGRGLICFPMSDEIVDRLNLPLMVQDNNTKYQTAFTVSIGAAEGITTGISAFDRSHTVAAAINPNAKPEDIVMPGHIFPLRAKAGGVLSRQGHTEASVDLSRLADFNAAGVICEIMSEDGSMARLPELKVFAKRHDLNIISINQLIAYRVKHDNHIQEVATAQLPRANEQQFQLKVFNNLIDNAEHLALVHGDIETEKACLVRVHSECLTGDVFGSTRCDCGEQLSSALDQMAQSNGILIYLRQEGRGIGLTNKIKAYALQEQGLDTVEANHQLGLPTDMREYSIAAQILHNLGIKKIKLLTNNPQKIESLSQFGLEVESRESIQIKPGKNNLAYLNTKQKKMGHLLDL